MCCPGLQDRLLKPFFPICTYGGHVCLMTRIKHKTQTLCKKHLESLTARAIVSETNIFLSLQWTISDVNIYSSMARENKNSTVTVEKNSIIL